MELEYEKFFCESKCESGLQNGPAPAKAARPSNLCGREGTAARMCQRVEKPGGDKTPVRLRAEPGQRRLAANGGSTGVVPGLVSVIA
jgi:hypothetical protein